MKASLERLEQEQIQARRGLAGKIDQAIQGRGEKPVQVPMTTNQEEQIEYDRARRTARIWPIQEDGDAELSEAVADFLAGALELSLEEVGEFKVKKQPDRPGNPNRVVYSEVTVEFRSQEVRDMVMAQGPKLSGYIDDNKRPTCGLRQEVPAHLLPVFKTLHRYGMNLRKKIGNHVKKHIKFDDFNKGLFIQVKVEDGGEWINVSPEEASASNRRGDAKKTQRLKSLLSPETSAAPRSGTPVSERTGSGQDEATYHTPQPMQTEEGVASQETSKAKQKWKPPPRNIPRK